MTLLRLLTLVVIFYIVFAALKAFLRSGKARTPGAGQNGEPMVFDPQCETYVPQSAAISRDGKYFCSEECARLFLSR